MIFIEVQNNSVRNSQKVFVEENFFFSRLNELIEIMENQINVID